MQSLDEEEIMELVLGRAAHAATAPIRGASLPLTMVRAGDEVTVVKVRGREDSSRHLANLGFVEGARVRVISKSGGDTIVNVKGSKLGLDRDTAKRILTA